MNGYEFYKDLTYYFRRHFSGRKFSYTGKTTGTQRFFLDGEIVYD